MKKQNVWKRGFTLIELLVVIVIIGLLAAIIIPSINGALKTARRARALRQMTDLDGAIKRYFAEYGRMPAPAGQNGGADKVFTGSEQAQVVEILINNSLDATLNPRQLTFLDLDPASFGVKTAVQMQTALRSGTPYRDPWGGDYGILMDLDFDDKITGTAYGDLRAKVAVYSGGEATNTVTPPYKTW